MTRDRLRVTVAFAALGLWWGAFGALVPAIQRSARVDDGELGLALLFVGVGALALMRAEGALIDRYGEVVLPLTLAGFAASGVLPGLSHGTAALAAALAVVGGASGALDVAVNAAAVQLEAHTGRPIMSLAHGWFSLGVIAGSLTTGGLRAAGASPLSVLVLFAALLGGIAAATGLGVEAHPRDTPPEVEISGSSPWWRPPARLAVLGVLTALAFLVESAWQTWSAVHLERDLQASPFVGSAGPALFGAAAAAGRLAGHRYGSGVDPRALVRAGALLAAAGSLVAAAAPQIGLVLAGIGAAGLGTSICAPSLFGLTGAGVDARRRGAAISTVTTIGYLGFVVAPAVVGAVADAATLPVALGCIGGVSLGLAAVAPLGRPAGPGEAM